MEDIEILRESLKKLKVGRYIVIDNIPCKIVNIDTSAPGKHGHSKMRVTAIGVFGGQKKTLLKSSDEDVEIPIVKKKRAQVISVSSDTVQLMDSATYEIYALPIPDELKEKLNSDTELEIIEIMGQKKISRTAGSE